MACNSKQIMIAGKYNRPGLKLAQGDGLISISADRFKQGWAGMSQAAGGERASAVAHAIRTPV